MMAWMSCLEVGYLRALVDSNAVPDNDSSNDVNHVCCRHDKRTKEYCDTVSQSKRWTSILCLGQAYVFIRYHGKSTPYSNRCDVAISFF